MEIEELYEDLLRWLRTFPVAAHVENTQQLSDGVIFARVLNSIDDDNFDSQWLSALKCDASINWRIKVSNLKKVFKSMKDYYTTMLTLPINEPFMPDLNAIGECDSKKDVCRFIQLLLCLAINSPKKETLIAAIMELENITKQALMEAIQEIMDQDKKVDHHDYEEKYNKILEENRKLTSEREALAQRCHDLERENSSVKEERFQLQRENETLNRQCAQLTESNQHLTASAGSPSRPTGATGGGLPQPNVLSEAELNAKLRHSQDMVTRYKEDVYRLESMKEDFTTRIDELEKENSMLRLKQESLLVKLDEVRILKDEMDALKETNERLQQYQDAVEKYKKRLEATDDLQGQLTRSEEKNANYLQKIMEMEEELAKSQSVRNQLEMLRGQSSDLQCKMADLVKRADKAEFDCGRMQEKLQTAQNEIKVLREQRDELKEKVEDLELSTGATSLTRKSYETLSMSVQDTEKSSNAWVDQINLIDVPSEVREKVMRLQREVNRLRHQQQENQQPLSVKDLDDNNGSLAALERMQEENRSIYQENLRLQAQIEDLMAASVSDATLKSNAQALSEVNNLRNQLSQMREEKETMESKYIRYLEKAKIVIRQMHLERISNSNAAENQGADGNKTTEPSQEVKLLREQLAEKHRIIAEMEKHFESTLKMREEEEKMFISAWYNLGMQLNRQGVEDRMKQIGGENVVGQSFLAKQRSAHLHGRVVPRPDSSNANSSTSSH